MSVYFIVEGRSLKISEGILQKSEYFSRLLKNEVYSEARITVPDWMSLRHLEIYFSYLSSKNIPKLDILTTQKVL